MKIFEILNILIIFNIYSFYCLNITTITNIGYINEKNNYIDNAIYVIRTRKGDGNLEFTKDNYAIFSNNRKIGPKINYVIEKDNNNSSINETYFYIKENSSKKKISVSINENDKDKIILLSTEIDNELSLWKIIPKINSNNQLIYYVQNKKSKRFWQYDKYNNISQIVLSKTNDINILIEDNEFQFVRMYKESNKNESKLLEDEPIDVLNK